MIIHKPEAQVIGPCSRYKFAGAITDIADTIINVM